ncbi:MAG: hypothetical protein ACXADS_09805 [Candidatus Thorarchaeota archaeon]|jgi:hypothetical protein
MREVEILLSNEGVVPGDTITGNVIVRTDDDFECQRAYVTLLGEEESKVAVHVGKVTAVHRDTRKHTSQIINLVADSVIPFGESRYDFSFKIPENAPGSYEGVHGRIRYVLKAQVEISWTRNLKSELRFDVAWQPSSETLESKPQAAKIEHDGKTLLKIEAEKDVVTLGDRVPIRLWVSPRMKIRGVRAEIVSSEYVEPKGYKQDVENVLATSYLEDAHLRRDSWVDMNIETEPNWRRSFKTDLIEYNHRLKVTLDIPMRLDRKIEIPIELSGRVEGSSEADPFGFQF